MHTRKILALAVASTAFILGTASAQTPQTPEKTKPQETAKPAATEKAPADKINVHGGNPHQTAAHAFEVVFVKNGIIIYPYDIKGEPLAVDGLNSSITLTPKKAGEKPNTITAKATPGKDKTVRGFLIADTDLAAAAKDSMMVKITISGLKNDKEKEATFEIPFTGLSPDVKYVCTKCKMEGKDPGECTACKVVLEKKVVQPKS